MRPVDLAAFSSWLERYFAAWASNDADEVASLFTEDAEYSYGPFRPSARGRDEIVRRWVGGGVPPELRTSHEVLAVDGNIGVAHWTVSFRGERGTVETDGILVCTFDAEGRCSLHREWYERRETPAG
jgi:ketosteroid isomerase-like protein